MTNFKNFYNRRLFFEEKKNRLKVEIKLAQLLGIDFNFQILIFFSFSKLRIFLNWIDLNWIPLIMRRVLFFLYDRALLLGRNTAFWN